MKRMSSAEIRQAFLDYFARHGHQVVAASSLVPGNDPTLLFTNAGMVQFKDVFLGHDSRPYVRATTAQKCMRISGKHNDLENVGPSPRHHTFFEMLGNFSFGDYFKRDAIKYAYQLLTEVYGLPPDRLAFTVYQSDDEAYETWVNEVGVDPKRVARMGSKTNFWQMADIGPCGPTSEIHWDLQPELGMEGIIEALQREEDRFLELWNLVFMQYNRTQPDDEHTGKYDVTLPAPGVDTGMGLERITAVVQQAAANYETDLFVDVMDATQEILGHDDALRDEHYVAYRVIADHIRAASFLIADGVNPGTDGREYVTRMLIRRAMRFAHKMGVNQPFLHKVAEAVIHKMSPIYVELDQFRDAIVKHIQIEEENFLRTLDSALDKLDQMIEAMQAYGLAEMSGEEAFFLHSTHGLPLEITRDVLQEHGLTVNQKEFEAAREEHSRRSDTIKREIKDQSSYVVLLGDLRTQKAIEDGGVEYDPYDYNQFSVPAGVLAILHDGKRVDRVNWRGDTTGRVEVVLDRTPFYVESGGQVSDTGIIRGDDWEFEVEDAIQPVGGLILHVGRLTAGDSLRVGDNATAIVNNHRRWDIMRNHTATHLLHASLREVLGTHVRQKGSLVASDRLRFDFSHNEPVTDEELDQIATQVNELILANEGVVIGFKPRDVAVREGAMALFGEKYGETVRTVIVGDSTRGNPRWSYELCGGTHVRSTAEIGPLVIAREESSGGGVRRIVAVTGREAQRLLRERMDILTRLARRLDADPESITEKIEDLEVRLRESSNRLEILEQQSARRELDGLLSQAKAVGNSRIVAAQVKASDPDLLGQMADWCRDRLASGVVVLGSEIDGRALLVAKVTPDLVSRGVKAGDLVRELAKVVGGGGGGRPDFATAGGKNPSALPAAIARVEELVMSSLS